MKTQGNTMLVTGGGSGIGRALSRRWHDAGNHVIVAGRREEALKETIGERRNMTFYAVDLDDPAEMQNFADRLVAEHPTLNVLVNNAGIMRMEELHGRRDLSDAEATITTNLLGPIRLIDALVEQLSAQQDSAIVNVTSGLATVPQPMFATYSATKAALHSYTISLRNRLKGKVEVIELVPPGVQTDLTPGQATRPGYMPLEEFADEVIGLFAQQPTPGEVLVERVKAFRFAERDGSVEEKAEMLANMPR